MALSDACFEFMQATADAAETLAAAVYHYAAPDYPVPYGVEIDALRRACAAVKERPYDPASGAELLRLASSIMTFHDTPPDTPERQQRESHYSHRGRKRRCRNEVHFASSRTAQNDVGEAGKTNL
jgi:hypothetical protein